LNLEHILDIPSETKLDDNDLVREWQDLVLANAFTANYLNNLLVRTSRQDFPFIIPNGYLPKYIQDPASFRQTISKLSAEILVALTDAREDLNRVHTGMDVVPNELRTVVEFLKQAPYDLFVLFFPDSFNKIESLVNNSLIVLRKPKENFEKVLNILTEIDFLLTTTPVDDMLAFQVSDVKTEWAFLTKLVNELAKQAESVRETFLLQYNWILKELLQPGMPFDESIRSFILRLLIPRIVELDQTSDLLGMVTKLYTDISFEYTDEEIGGNAYLILLTDETIRLEHLRKNLRQLPPIAVRFARLALKRHGEFLQRDQNRKTKYD
jgi:hypothetical protein